MRDLGAGGREEYGFTPVGPANQIRRSAVGPVNPDDLAVTVPVTLVNSADRQLISDLCSHGNLLHLPTPPGLLLLFWPSKGPEGYAVMLSAGLRPTRSSIQDVGLVSQAIVSDPGACPAERWIMRKRIVVLGGGTGGTLAANRLRRLLDRDTAGWTRCFLSLASEAADRQPAG